MTKHLCCSALLLLTVVGCGGGAAVPCTWGEGCVCLQCPAGQEPSKACSSQLGAPPSSEGEGLGAPPRCQPCPPLSFSSARDALPCQPHTLCGGLARHALRDATELSDALCGPCLDGFQPSELGTNSTLSPCVKESPAVRAVRTVGGGAGGGGGVASGGGPSGGNGGGGATNANATANVRSAAEERSAEYAVFALVPVFCLTGLAGIMICNLLKKRGYACLSDREKDSSAGAAGGETDRSMAKEGPDDPNEDTISVLVRLITEKKENAAALEELLQEYESKQMNINKTSSIKFPGLSPLHQFGALPRLCPHQSHLHTISGLSGLSGGGGGGAKHGGRHASSGCSRCAQRKWPPMLIPPLVDALKTTPLVDALRDPLKTTTLDALKDALKDPQQHQQTPLKEPLKDALKDPLKPPQHPLKDPTLDALKDPLKPPQHPLKDPTLDALKDPQRVSTDAGSQQVRWSPLVETVSVTTPPRTVAWQVEATTTMTTQRKQEVPPPSVHSVGRFQVAQIPEQKPVVVETETPSNQESSFNPLFPGGTVLHR